MLFLLAKSGVGGACIRDQRESVGEQLRLYWINFSLVLRWGARRLGNCIRRAACGNNCEPMLREQATRLRDLRLPLNFSELPPQAVQVRTCGFAHGGIQIGSRVIRR